MPANVMRPAKFCGFDIHMCMCVYKAGESEQTTSKEPTEVPGELGRGGRQADRYCTKSPTAGAGPRTRIDHLRWWIHHKGSPIGRTKQPRRDKPTPAGSTASPAQGHQGRTRARA